MNTKMPLNKKPGTLVFPLEHAFSEHLSKNAFFRKSDRLLLACSGGLDSVVLAHLLKRCGYVFELLHCNFNLRGEESKRDELFVRTLADTFGVPVRVQSFDTHSVMQATGKGVQETARELRYNWFKEVAAQVDAENDTHTNDPRNKKKHPPTWVLTAHHADDLAETMAMNFFRGTGLAGLHGIRERMGIFLRPLLFTTRDEVLAYAESVGIEWVEDSSNSSINYTRNSFRLRVFPEVETLFPSARLNLIANAKRFEEAEFLYRKQVEKIKSRLLEKKDTVILIAVNKLKAVKPLDTIMHEVFGEFGFSAAQVPEIKKLFNAETGKWMASSTHRILRNRAWLLIEPLEVKHQLVHVVEDGTTRVELNDAVIEFSHLHGSVEPDAHTHHAWIDAAELRYPLLVRPWKQGDYFYPLGMKRKKKLSRFLTDLKLSAFEKESIYVIESDKRIVWVVGERLDNRFRISSATQNTVLMKYSNRSTPDKNLAIR
jgi:tRNA(Ile)-lysidine synthase